MTREERARALGGCQDVPLAFRLVEVVGELVRDGRVLRHRAEQLEQVQRGRQRDHEVRPVGDRSHPVGAAGGGLLGKPLVKVRVLADDGAEFPGRVGR